MKLNSYADKTENVNKWGARFVVHFNNFWDFMSFETINWIYEQFKCIKTKGVQEWKEYKKKTLNQMLNLFVFVCVWVNKNFVIDIVHRLEHFNIISENNKWIQSKFDLFLLDTVFVCLYMCVIEKYKIELCKIMNNISTFNNI